MIRRPANTYHHRGCNDFDDIYCEHHPVSIIECNYVNGEVSIALKRTRSRVHLVSKKLKFNTHHSIKCDVTFTQKGRGKGRPDACSSTSLYRSICVVNSRSGDDRVGHNDTNAIANDH